MTNLLNKTALVETALRTISRSEREPEILLYGPNSFQNFTPSERIGSVRFLGVVKVGPFGQYQIPRKPATLVRRFEM